MTGLLVLCAASVASALAWLRHRRGPFATPPTLRLVARAGLTQKAGLALVEVEGRRLLVGYGDGPPALLDRLDPEVGARDAARETP